MSGYPTSTSIPRVDELSTDPREMGHHKSKKEDMTNLTQTLSRIYLVPKKTYEMRTKRNYWIFNFSFVHEESKQHKSCELNRGGKIGPARWASPVRPKLGPGWAIKFLARKKPGQIWPGPVWPSPAWPGPARPKFFLP